MNGFQLAFALTCVEFVNKVINSFPDPLKGSNQNLLDHFLVVNEKKKEVSFRDVEKFIVPEWESKKMRMNVSTELSKDRILSKTKKSLTQ